MANEPKATDNYSAPSKRPSKAWYLVPIFFGIIGGLIMYLILKDENMRMAKKGLTLGIVIGAVGIAFVIIIYGVLFGVILNNMHSSNYFGTNSHQINHPSGIGIDNSDNIYVLDNERVEKFNSAGVFQLYFGSPGSGNGQTHFPQNIAIDKANNIYLTDSGNNRVEKFDSSGNYLSQFGTAGSGNGQLKGPNAIAVDSSGNIYVVDQGNSRIEKFDSSGNYLSQFG